MTKEDRLKDKKRDGKILERDKEKEKERAREGEREREEDSERERGRERGGGEPRESLDRERYQTL